MNRNRNPAARRARRRLRRLQQRTVLGALRRLRARVRAAGRRLRNSIKGITSYINTAADRSLGLLIDGVRNNRLVRFLFGRGLRRSVILILGFVGLIALIVENVFMIGVTENAVILRFGRFDRMVDPGLAVKMPFLEKKYMVNTQLRLQENFGFIQYTPPPKPQTEREQERVEHEADVVAEAQQANLEKRGSGVAIDEIQRAPPLPRDYAVTLDPAPVPPPEPQAETEEVLERIELGQEALENVIPPDGKVPVPTDMKMLTGDLNIVYVTWSVQYEIVDAKAYLFRSTDVTQNLRDIAIVAMRTAVGDRLDRAILADGRSEIAEAARGFMQTQVDRYRLGLDIKTVIIQDANPPDEVRGAYHMVNQAKQEMEHLINQAQAEYNSLIPHSRGKAERAVAEARAYALELGNRSIGESGRFAAILEEYRKAPAVTRDRVYLEALEDVFGRTALTLIDADLRGILPLFAGRTPQPTAPPEAQALRAQPEAHAQPLVVLPEPPEQPMHLPHSTAVRELPWEPQEMPPEAVPSRPPAALNSDPRIHQVAPPEVEARPRRAP